MSLESYKKITLAGTSKNWHRDVYVLNLQLAAGSTHKLYFGCQTHLEVRLRSISTTGERLMEISFRSASVRVGKLTLSHQGRIQPDVTIGTKATP